MSKLETARIGWNFLKPLPSFWRLHQVVRSLVLPTGLLLGYLPQAETGEPMALLDLGCGLGVFLALAKRARPEIELVGLDLSDEKLAGAREAFEASGIRTRELAVKDIADFSKQSVDVITILDVLYLVPLERWHNILRKCHDCLKPGGRLLLKEMDRSIRWKFALLYLEETFAVKVLGLTLGSKFTFPTREQVSSYMNQAGFAVREVPLHRGYHVPHFLWIGTKGRLVAADCPRGPATTT